MRTAQVYNCGVKHGHDPAYVLRLSEMHDGLWTIGAGSTLQRARDTANSMGYSVVADPPTDWLIEHVNPKAKLEYEYRPKI